MAGRSGGVSWGGWSWRVGRSTTRGLLLLLSCGPCSLSCSGSCTRSRSRACPRAGPVGGRSGWQVGVGRDRGQAVRGTRCGECRPTSQPNEGAGCKRAAFEWAGSSGGGAGGGGGIPAWLEWKMVGAVVALGRVALSLHVYQGRRRACRAVVAWSATGESSCRCVGRVARSVRRACRAVLRLYVPRVDHGQH